MLREALGLIETKSLRAAMDALQAVSQGAAVEASLELIDASFAVIKIEGELAAVQAAVDAGAHAAQHAGALIAARIIPRANASVSSPAPRKRSSAPKVRTSQAKRPERVAVATPAEQPSSVAALEMPAVTEASAAVPYAELEAMPVVKLRQYARTVASLPLQGRQISMANKQQLLEAIRASK